MKTTPYFLLTALLSSLAMMTSAQPPGGPGGGILSFDADGDGAVSREEFQLPERRRAGPFERADADGDGAVSRDELIAEIDNSAEEREQRMRDHVITRFDESDLDGNGVVTQAELLDSAFSRVDANDDGFVTEEEARAMHEQRRAKRDRRNGEPS
ncbi:MAG: EF-hand domain-containing protein [Pseudomonadota bacterium]